MNGLFSMRVAVAGALIACAAALPAVASAKAPARASDPGAKASGASSCAAPALSQPFLPWGDANEYTPFPGETFDSVDGLGWTLQGGATLVTSALQDGSSGQVLDMPAGSVVVSTPLCVDASNYPSARAMVADVTGTEGVTVEVSYVSGADWSRLMPAGNIKNTAGGWYPSKPIMLHAGGLQGMHLLRLVLVAGAGEYRVYNLFVDPRRGH
jgi:hypothetical protein